MRSGVVLEEKEIKKRQALEEKLLHYTVKAINTFNLIERGDKVMICLSGGKDSYTLLHMLLLLRRARRYDFSLFCFTLDQSQPGWDDRGMRAYLDALEVDYQILKKDTYSIVKEKIPEGKTYCSLCSRLRRGNIYRVAQEQGVDKIALGHHRDDTIVTLLMSMMYAGEIRAMPPKLLSDNKKHLVIRPLIYCQEADIAEYARLKDFPIIPCNLCGSQEQLARKRVKNYLAQWTEDNPKVPSNLLHALSKITPSHLMDPRYWPFKTLEKDAVQEACAEPVEEEPFSLF